MSTSKLLLKVSLLALVLTCCGYQKPKNFDYGSVTDGIYKNSFFDFSIQLPEDFEIAYEPIIASEPQIAILLTARQYNENVFSPNIVISSEDVRAVTIRSGRDYLLHTKQILQKWEYDYISEDFEREEISKVAFFKMGTISKVEKTVVEQLYYSTIINGFSLSVILTYETPEQKDILLKTVHSMKFGL